NRNGSTLITGDAPIGVVTPEAEDLAMAERSAQASRRPSTTDRRWRPNLFQIAQQFGACLWHAGVNRLASEHHRPAALLDKRRGGTIPPHGAVRDHSEKDGRWRPGHCRAINSPFRPCRRRA